VTGERRKNLALRIIFGDMLLNWTLGALLTLLPRFAESIAGTEPMLPVAVWRAIGVGFLLFAAWQTWVVQRWDIGPDGLWFAGWMAWIPAVLLTIALLYMGFPLRDGARVALWVGDIYMFLLGGWYAFVARGLRAGGLSPRT
jgi:hypothetical protein